MVISNPLEQFQNSTLFSFFVCIKNEFWFDISAGKYMISLGLILITGITICHLVGLRYNVGGPLDYVVNALVDIAKFFLQTQVGPKGKKFLPIFTTWAFVLFLSNFLGMIPYNTTSAAQLIIAGVLALVPFTAYNIMAIYLHSEKFLTLFYPAGTPLPLAILIVPIEIVSYCFRVISLAVRLFANMMAGHTLLKVIANFGESMLQAESVIVIYAIIPISALVLSAGLEYAVAFIQAYVFLTLISMYYKDALTLH
jgi:ATP synthase subunit 6